MAGPLYFVLWFLLSSSFFLSFFLAYLSGRRFDVHTTILLRSANLECRSEMCCTRLAGNTGPKNRQKIVILAPWHNFGTTKALVDNRKKLLNSNVSPTCPHNMVNFGILAAEIYWRVWGTPWNFNGFRVLAALLHGTLIVGVSQTAALNRGRHLYSTGRPSHWALAHISS